MRLFSQIFLTLSTVVNIRGLKSVTVGLYLGITAIGLAAVWGPGSELQAATITVTNTADSGVGSLRQALMDASSVSVDTIDFSVTGTITLTTGHLVIDKDVIIIGPGPANLTINGDNNSRIFFIDDPIVVAISEMTISGGNDLEGGGIFNDGTLTLLNVTVSDNTAGIGGGIYNEDNGTLTLFNVTVSGNTAGDGGGIFNDGIATLTNSTVSENFATDSGGILNGGPAILINVTVADNIGDDVGGITGQFVTLKNTIIANNFNVDRVTKSNCQNSYTSLGHNLDSDGTCGLGGTGDLNGIDPKLGPLQDNGGPTETHALLAGSPAIDAGTNTGCPTTDQRGFTRSDATCDIGAFEFGAILGPMSIDIDIKPGSFPSSWPCKKIDDGIPVAILSTDTFDATTVHADTVFFGTTNTATDEVHKKDGKAKRHVEDVNKDGLPDMVFHFRFGDTGFSCDDIPAGENSVTLPGKLTGATDDGTPIQGEDTLRLVRK